MRDYGSDSGRDRTLIPYKIKRPAWLHSRILVTIDSYNPDEPTYFLIVMGVYEGGFTEEALRKYLVDHEGLSEERTRILLGYAKNFGVSAFNPRNNEMLGDRWDLSEYMPPEIWSRIKNLWAPGGGTMPFFS